MTHLRDLEELISSVHSLESRDYMREAVSCYMAGAYRACVVLTFIALFDDITKKLAELGKVNKKARTLSQEVEKRINEQDVFESYLLDQLKSLNLIPAIDHEFYTIVKTLRNKSAHPSGHRCSAEEARFVMFESINRFMKNPLFSTTQACDEILARLSDSNLFPSNIISHTAQAVKKEMENVHEDALPYLLEKIIDKYTTADKTLQRNCKFFINSLAKLDKEEYCKQIRIRLIEKKITNKDFHSIVFSAACANAKVLTGIDEVTVARLKAVLSSMITDRNISDRETLFNHPTTFFCSIIDANMSNLITNELKKELNDYIDKFPYSSTFLPKALPCENLRKIIIENILELAGSNTFSTANSFAEHSEELDEIIGDHLSTTEALTLILKIEAAAETGAWGSIRLRDANYQKIGKVREKAKEFIASNAAEALELCEQNLPYRPDAFEDISTRLV